MTSRRKRCFDIVLVAILLVPALPVMLIITVAQIFSGQPVLFWQKRVGLGGCEFQMPKFCSMYEGAEERLRKMLEQDSKLAEEWNRYQKLKVDPRVTPLGGVLRSTSLDELPQLFLVLSGKMSLVGPRPTMPEQIQMHGIHTASYIACRPGLTGIWQVSGRANTSYEFRAECDSQYVGEAGFAFDVRILISTIRVLILMRGAH